MHGKLYDAIINWDYTVWYFINVKCSNAFFDAFVPFLRNPLFWSPLYLFLALFMPIKFRGKGFLWCLGFIISFILSDQISATLLKPHFHRLRPCHNPSLQNVIHLLVDCGGLYSFPSSHATNHFSIAFFSILTLQKEARWIWPVGILWAAAVSFAQVYVGVHYPLDVTCGALLGITIGILTGTLFNRFIGLHPKQQSLAV